MHSPVIYLGPSLSRREAVSTLGVEYDIEFRPPICRGDLAKLPPDVESVGIIDGEFFQSLAVSTKEILPLLRRGIRMFGAASMGALRACETCRFGMVGVGEIFRMYCDGTIDGDDEVAVTYEPVTFRCLSDPLVNIRRALELAEEAGVIDRGETHRLLMRMKATYFPDRSFRALEMLSPLVGEFLRAHGTPDLKADDARGLLLHMKATALE
jgi:hypothetical protein